MGPDLNAAPRTSTCPACGAGLRPDAPWCSLCYHDLRPPPAPVVPEPTPVYGEPDPLTAPLLDMLLPQAPEAPAAPEAAQAAVPAPALSVAETEVTWPCTACGARNPLATTACRDCGSPFLAGASEPPSLVLPGIGDLGQMSRGRRAAVAVGVLMVVLLPLALITFLMTGKPPSSGTGTETTVTTVSP